MSLVAQFFFKGLTTEQYDQIVQDLEDSGHGSPKGRLYHVAAFKDDSLLVTDVWESEETLKDFGEIMIPITIKNGGVPSPPTVLPVHNIIVG